MRRRALHWLVLCFTTLWFGVLVPVHNRGEINLPGGRPSALPSALPAEHAAARHCHPAEAAPAGSPADESTGGRPPCHDPDSPTRGACAVCFFVAGLDAPPPVTLVETRLGLVGVCDSPRPFDPPAARVRVPFHSRAPPAA